jgi:hypothetical protein
MQVADPAVRAGVAEIECEIALARECSLVRRLPAFSIIGMNQRRNVADRCRQLYRGQVEHVVQGIRPLQSITRGFVGPMAESGDLLGAKQVGLKAQHRLGLILEFGLSTFGRFGALARQCG